LEQQRISMTQLSFFLLKHAALGLGCARASIGTARTTQNTLFVHVTGMGPSVQVMQNTSRPAHQFFSQSHASPSPRALSFSPIIVSTHHIYIYFSFLETSKTAGCGCFAADRAWVLFIFGLSLYNRDAAIASTRTSHSNLDHVPPSQYTLQS
jgi:hypothetical protein